MQKLGNPVPMFLDTLGALMDGGYIYVGVADGDPETSPVDLFWDAALSIPATQPLRTIGGLIVNGFNPSSVFLAEEDYSMRVTDNIGTLVFYSPSVFSDTSAFQPSSPTLDLLADLSTTAFGRNLLTLANQAALVTATGIPTPLPAAGGTVTGDINRQGAGDHLYWVDAGMTGGRVFWIEEGDPDPSSLPGDVVFTVEP